MSESITVKDQQAITPYDEELAKIAREISSQESVLGEFYSVAAGQLKWGGSPIPGNQMVVVVLDGVHENIYYGSSYDPDVRVGPLCFALGRVEAELAPHEKVVAAGSAQATKCAGCEFNEWGSAEKGKGKACKNVRRLALLNASKIERDGSVTLIEDPEYYREVTPGYLRVPVTSVKNYSALVTKLDQSMHLPTFAVYTRVSVHPDPKTQVKVLFEPIKPVPTDVLPVLLERFREGKGSIMFTGSVMSLEDREAQKAAAEAEAKKSARKRKF